MEFYPEEGEGLVPRDTRSIRDAWQDLSLGVSGHPFPSPHEDGCQDPGLKMERDRPQGSLSSSEAQLH